MSPITKPYRVLFSLRREFYDAVLAGIKTVEYRRDTPRWLTVALHADAAIKGGRGSVATLQCGRRVHRRKILGVTRWDSLGQAIGRVPRVQDVWAVGTGPVLAFALGEVVS